MLLATELGLFIWVWEEDDSTEERWDDKFFIELISPTGDFEELFVISIDDIEGIDKNSDSSHVSRF